LKCADGRTEAWSFQDLAAWSSRFANLLETESIAKGDRVAVMLDPSLAFYGAIFGAVKRGAVAVPLFTLLGPDGVRLRVDDCQPLCCSSRATPSAGRRFFHACASSPWSTGSSVGSLPRARATLRRRAPTISPSSSTRRGRPAGCPRRCATLTARS